MTAEAFVRKLLRRIEDEIYDWGWEGTLAHRATSVSDYENEQKEKWERFYEFVEKLARECRVSLESDPTVLSGVPGLNITLICKSCGASFQGYHDCKGYGPHAGIQPAST